MTVTWIDTTDVLGALGHAPVTQTDIDWLAGCTAAANDWCFTRRQNAGYTDTETVVPNDAVKLGTILYAAACYKERGATESFASFDAFVAVQASGNYGQVKRLLGVDRPQVA